MAKYTLSCRPTVILDPRIKDLTGQRFGRLVVLAYAGPITYGTSRRRGKNSRAGWWCRCDCGTYLPNSVPGDSLRKGNTRSCGCLVRDSHHQTHGLCRSPEYRVWTSMKHRCYTPHYRTFRHYGGRGIRVCDRWRESFANFIADVGRRPSPNHTLERLDNDGDYCPENCAWVPQAANQANRRCTIRLTHNGETLLLTEWAQRLSIDYVTLLYRLRRGWSAEQTLTTPIKGHPKS